MPDEHGVRAGSRRRDRSGTGDPMNTEGETPDLERAVRRGIIRALDNRHLKLTILPTEQCNFRCTYCYEDFELGMMPRWAVDGLKRLMTVRAPELRVLDLRWFGGEPLMAFPIVAELCEHAQTLE